MTVVDFRKQFAALKRGDCFIYYVGHLVSGRRRNKLVAKMAVESLAREAWRLYRTGHAVLGQRRIGYQLFEYLIWRSQSSVM